MGMEENEDGYKLPLLHLSSKLRVKPVLDILIATLTADLLKKQIIVNLDTGGYEN